MDSIRGRLPDRNAGYITMAADVVLSGGLDLEGLCRLSDEEVVKTLTALPGIGRWTAEMLLIFSMRRPDVVSYSDLGIRRGMKRVYGLKELTREQFMHYRNRYSPYGTVVPFIFGPLQGIRLKGVDGDKHYSRLDNKSWN